jgi:hypothetical protein
MRRSVTSATATFDLDRNEWGVVVIECAGAPTIIERKRRRGVPLSRSYRTKVVP